MMHSDLGCQRYLEGWGRWTQGVVTGLGWAAETLARLAGLAVLAGGRVLVCGNGGSAADAAHFAAELVGRFALERAPVPAMALGEAVPTLTAVANDYGYPEVFARQVAAWGRPGDCLIALSTSGQSANVIAALRAAKAAGLLTVALVGPGGLAPPAAACTDLVIAVPKPQGWADGLATPHIQEAHMALLHAVAGGVERLLLRSGEGQGDEGAADRPAGGRRRAVFVDRDGTLIVKREAVTRPAEVELLPGAGPAVARLNRAGVQVVLVTNQAAVGRGQLTEEALCRINLRLEELLADHGAHLDGVYCCTHAPLGAPARPGGPAGPTCACRKPLPGMMLAAAAELGLELGAAWTIGDTLADLKAGLAAGGRAGLVLTGLGRHQGDQGGGLPAEVCGRWGVFATLSEVVERVLEGRQPASAAHEGSRPG